jgi:1-acyl-sn-glycerol-3-phosphate acyltransferase
MNNILSKYRFNCTLTLGDIFGQVVVWLGVVFASLAAALALMSRPIYAIAAVGLIVVASLPFLLFAFVVTLFSHIEISPLTEEEVARQQPKARITMKAALQ